MIKDCKSPLGSSLLTYFAIPRVSSRILKSACLILQVCSRQCVRQDSGPDDGDISHRILVDRVRILEVARAIAHAPTVEIIHHRGGRAAWTIEDICQTGVDTDQFNSHIVRLGASELYQEVDWARILMQGGVIK